MSELADTYPVGDSLTPAEAAAIAGVSVAWLAREARGGRIHSIRSGTRGHRRYFRAEIEAVAKLRNEQSGRALLALDPTQPTATGALPSPLAAAPNVARMYDYLLGGKNNFESDRLAATNLARIVPDIASICRHNRQFLQRAVRFLASEQGIRQFVDIGTGLPTQGNVHETAQVIEPSTRVLYVDNDPIVVSHAQALLVNAPTVVAINRDLRQPRQIIDHPALQALIDLDRPVAILLVAILHFIPDEADVYGIVDELKAVVPSGSFLALSHATGDNVPTRITEQVRELYAQTNAPAAPRTRAGIARFFHGLEMVGPGLVPVSAWPFQEQRAQVSRTIFLAGVGRKP